MKKFSNGEISNFCEELAMFVDSGVSEEEALIRMAEDDKNVIAELIKNKYDMNLSKALTDTGAFPDYMVDMVEIGESTGRLGKVLLNLAEYYERQEDSENRVSSLIIYPSILMFILSGILLFIAIKVFPIFKDVYQSLGGLINENTAWLISFATVVSWVLFIACLLTGIVSVILYRRWKNSLNKKKVLKTLSKTSYTSKIAYEMDLAKFTSAVSNYYSAGIDLESAMSYAMKLVDSDELRVKLGDCIADSEAGEDIAKAFRNKNIYGPVNNRTLFGAINSGKLSEGLETMAAQEWDLVEQRLHDVTDSVEPVITLVISVVIGLLLISIMTPLIGILTAIS